MALQSLNKSICENKKAPNFAYLARCWILLGFLIGCNGAIGANITDKRTLTTTLVDSQVDITYHLDSDNRHVVAQDRQGRVLWRSYPYFDAKLPFYRISNPSITYFAFATPEKWECHRKYGRCENFILINFSSSQFGLLDRRNGAFIFLGQD